MADKIKAIQPMITVGGKIEKPCYSITYYDTSDKMWHIGFGSFDLANVKKWLKEDFEVVAETADVAEVKHGEWIGEYEETCSECGRSISEILDDGSYYSTEFNIKEFIACPYCGAKMDGKDITNDTPVSLADIRKPYYDNENVLNALELKAVKYDIEENIIYAER